MHRALVDYAIRYAYTERVPVTSIDNMKYHDYREEALYGSRFNKRGMTPRLWSIIAVVIACVTAIGWVGYTLTAFLYYMTTYATI